MKKFLTLSCSLIMAFSMLFAVGCKFEQPPEDVHALTVGNIYAWVGYPPSQFVLNFTHEEDSLQEATFEYDETKMVLDSSKNLITVKAEGDFEVKVSAGSLSTTFKVYGRVVDKENAVFNINADWQSYANTMQNKYAAEGTDGKTTVFIGDSFFDTRYFWSKFYDTYKGKDAISFGIGSTTSYTWEKLSETLLNTIQPKNIVVHVGTNNVYDQRMNTDETIEALQRLFTIYRAKMPNTQFYCFSITQRTYDERRQKSVTLINKAMMEFSEGRPWLTYMHTTPKLTIDTLMSDGIHPLAESYKIFVDALEEAGIQIEDKA